MLDAIRGVARREPAEIVDGVFAVLDEHVAAAPLRDDLTFVALRT